MQRRRKREGMPMTDDLLARIDRIESYQAIQQLPIRYALAVDGRDIDAWLNLFIDDVDCGRRGKGREALKSYIAPAVQNFYRSQHLICGHRIDFVDADHATGEVYCRAEHEDGDAMPSDANLNSINNALANGT